jgi:NADH:ubiquinone oxidoreductase subunit F (NADH-binding)
VRIVVNGAEGEPGTFKDRALMRANPYQVVEGMAIAAYAIDAHDAYIGIKARFEAEYHRLEQALEEMAGARMLGDLDVTIVRGPGEYLFEEEKALLEVIEGGDPLPRILPPFQHGLFATRPQLGWSATPPEPGEAGTARDNPTLVNNVETLSHVPAIVARGPGEFRAEGTAAAPGTMTFTACGDVRREGVWELPLGTPLRVLVEECGRGVRDGHAVKMICSGVANPVLPGTQIDTPMDFESLARAGGGLGSAGFVVYDDSVCAVAVARLFSRFLHVESCGQCPPCKVQSGAITDALERFEAEGDGAPLAVIERALATVADGNRCFLAVEEQQVVASILRQFADDFVAHQEGHCALRHDLVIPLLVDLDGDHFVYDEDQMRKQPDWTFAPAPA